MTNFVFKRFSALNMAVLLATYSAVSRSEGSLNELDEDLVRCVLRFCALVDIAHTKRITRRLLAIANYQKITLPTFENGDELQTYIDTRGSSNELYLISICYIIVKRIEK